MLLLFGIFITLLGPPVEALDSSNAVVAQQAANSISGYVSDDRRNPLPDLQIELLNEVDSVIQRTKTDNSGLFGFRRLTTGIFQVRVQTYGTSYIGQTKRVQLEPTRAFEQVDFVLTTKDSSATKGTPGSVFAQEVPEPARKEYERGGAAAEDRAAKGEGKVAHCGIEKCEDS